ncbi:MAG: hypothetical protein H6822_18390 [Planctomycetaceae bacterium]|nr:hypothetical protein [Planctomycetales bacterium]MCB9924156.1 hypothetical protein [Planctomycetaceae bacterium]
MEFTEAFPSLVRSARPFSSLDGLDLSAALANSGVSRLGMIDQATPAVVHYGQ